MAVKIKNNLLLTAFLLLGLTLAPLGGKALDLKQFTHSDKELEILVLTSRNTAELEELSRNPQRALITVLQIPYEKFTPRQAELLLNWIKQGGSLWFYDSRYGKYFGIENSPLKMEEFKGKSYNGDFGSEGKLPGAVAQTMPSGNHPVVSGLNYVMVFLLKIGDNQYSAVKINDQITPLLITGNPPRAVSAIAGLEKGKAILKPLVFLKDKFGDKLIQEERFQINLKEYSAGFPVPDWNQLLGEKKEADLSKIDPKKDTVLLKSGKIFQGEIKLPPLSLETASGLKKLDLKEILMVEFAGNNGLDVVWLKKGEKYKGICLLKGELTISTEKGGKLNFTKMELKKLIFKSQEHQAW